jgi:protein tyrosine/serine phosphatase
MSQRYNAWQHILLNLITFNLLNHLNYVTFYTEVFMKQLTLLLLFLSFYSCNFHPVEEGKFYRSGQMTKNQLERAIDKYGFKTVINLRGYSPDKDWYQDEAEVTQRLGVDLIDIGMSAQRLPHKEDLITLLDSFRDAKRPILIHCAGGADRTGEATAIYKMLYMGKSKKKALWSLSPIYGHLKKRFPAKRYFIKELWQGEDWARRTYDPCFYDYEHYDKEANCN